MGRTLGLGRLTLASAGALLDDVCPVTVSPTIRARLLAEGAGHPGVLTALAGRLSPAQLTGAAPLPYPLVQDPLLAEVYRGLLEGLPAAYGRLLTLVAVAGEATAGSPGQPAQAGGVGADAVLAAARATKVPPGTLDALLVDGLLRGPREALRFGDPLLRRALLAAAPRTDLFDASGAGSPPSRASVARGRAALAQGLVTLTDGPVEDAHQVLLLAAGLLRDGAPEEAADARLLAMEAAWSAGDAAACLTALGDAEGVGGLQGDASERDFVLGMRTALSARPAEARAPLARVVDRDGGADTPRLLMRAGSAALVLGDTDSAARIHARALARARAEQRTSLLPRILEHLAYAELRAGRHERAAAHAREGLRAAERTGQRNVAAHQHAVLALAASVAGDAESVTEHAGRSLATARPHGLAQAATLAEWALARSELSRGLAAPAAARLAPLVHQGPRGGHFALRMLIVPCFVEAACASGRTAEALSATEEFALWAAQGIDPQAPAQLARCRALTMGGDESAHWYGEAVRRHEEVGNDFERARTLLAYGTWLRRRRRPLQARALLSDALVTFERAAAKRWAGRARAELRATGGTAAGAGSSADPWGLTPQQQRIAAMVAEGSTNHEIADRLSLSPRTVDHHLRNVFARLGVRSRVELSGVLARTAPPLTSHHFGE
ncbi:helix-turn-helix domain-containing protein [Streptomyces vilmorinianum]|uniref:helix-turn-helix domain-containing protein n=1 Tax=Streptomyces vilmorinianum TaxID=3051092 RepID=UPI001586DC1C|nr:helix-turn-helix transcriptional regulator [Streptomyces vilmorinianum]